MSKLLIQAVTLSGKIIEPARWEIEFHPGLQVGNVITLTFPITNAALMKYINKQESQDMIVYRDENEEETDKDVVHEYMVSLSFAILNPRHMLNTKTKTMESMISIVPRNRIVESIVLCLLTPSKCDPKFIALIHGA